MPFPLIASALGLVQFAPIIAKWLGGEQSEQMAAQVMDIAEKITGYKDPVEISQAFKENSVLAQEFQK